MSKAYPLTGGNSILLWYNPRFVSDVISPSLVLSERLKRINERIKKAAEKSGRSEDCVTLVAVTKTIPTERILECVRLGVLDIGENKIQEAMAKRSGLEVSGLRHHFIGHLQTNKARKAVELFDLIQTVDRPSLAETLDRISSEKGKRQACLVEVKVAKEDTKSGIPLAEAEAFINSFSKYPHLHLAGLMTIGTNGATAEETRASFQVFKALSERVRPCFSSDPILSFGMSDDFELAIEEGSTMVRVGRALFGERTI